jgi:hypothetical protein
MRCLLLCVLVMAACGDNAGPRLHDDAGTGIVPDAGPSSGRVAGCLDTADVARAPATQLPCDLVPPGLQL